MRLGWRVPAWAYQLSTPKLGGSRVTAPPRWTDSCSVRRLKQVGKYPSCPGNPHRPGFNNKKRESLRGCGHKSSLSARGGKSCPSTRTLDLPLWIRQTLVIHGGKPL